MREGIQIGPLIIRYYALIIMAGVIAAAWLAVVEAKRRDQKDEIVWDSLPWIVIGGIVGARIWHILTPPASMVEQGITTMFYLTHPLDAIAIWKGGVGIPGGIIGGTLAFYIYAKRNKVNFLLWADIIVPGLALAQAIGRWGNFINQELYGAPSHLPWAISIDLAHRLPSYENIARYHPLFLYESLLNLLIVGLLLSLGRRYADKLKDGDLFMIYLILYPVVRFGLEFMRLDPSPVAGVNANQLLMAVVALASSTILIIRHSKKFTSGRKEEAEEGDTESKEISSET